MPAAEERRDRLLEAAAARAGDAAVGEVKERLRCTELPPELLLALWLDEAAAAAALLVFAFFCGCIGTRDWGLDSMLRLD